MTQPTTHVALAAPEDLPAAAVVLDRSRRVTYANLLNLAYEPGSLFLEQWLKRHTRSGLDLRVAKRNRRVVGLILNSSDSIETLHVDPSATGTGIGRALMTAALDALQRPAKLQVAEENTPARKFYQRSGWADTNDPRRVRPGLGVAASSDGLVTLRSLRLE